MTKGSTQDEFESRLLELVLAEGIRDLTVAEIAARLRCSRRRLYEIADSKEGLLCAMAERVFASAIAQSDELVASEPDATVALPRFLDIGVRVAAGLGAPFLRDLDAIDATREAFDRYQQARSERLVRLIDAGVEQGVFTPCHGQVVAETMFGAALRLRRPAFLARAGLTMDEAFGEFYRVVLDGLLLRSDDARKAAAGRSERAPRASGRRHVSASRKDVEPTDDAADLLLKAWNRD